MPLKKTGFNIDQHEQLGKELQAMHNRLTTISVDLSKAYPVKSNVTGVVNQTINSLYKLREKMDNLAIKEHGEKGEPLYLRGGKID